ncbi:MAG: tryptophan-rich sensory protein [Syntrophomonadaceae bacterium]|nr:tryptophan-rich sensory protein [Syntrophomonadaceae bacterium]
MQDIYNSLRKPVFAVNGKIFRPVWFFIFFLMIVAVLKLYIIGWDTPGAKLGMLAFMLHAVCDSLWMNIFFEKKRRDLAVLDITGSFVFLALSVFLLFKVDRLVSYLLVPGLIWLGYLTILCVSIWLLNKNTA